MASTFSPLKIELIATGEQSGTWGTTTNVNLGTAIEEAITGSADVTFASGNVTVTLTDVNTTQIARNLRLNLVGTSSGPHQLILGSGCNIEKLYLVNNTLSHDITVVNTAGGTSVVVPATKSMFLYNTGTNVVDAITHVTNASTTTLNATNLEVTNLKAKDGTAAGSIANSTGVVTLASTVLTTTDINGGTIDGTTIGGSSAAAGTFTTVNATDVNATTVDTTNIEVTNLKAKDGTAAGTIANATGVVTLNSSVLTTADINGGTMDGVIIGSSGAAAATVTVLTANNDSAFNSTGALKLPVGTSGQQPGSPAAGMIRFNSSTVGFEGYNGTAWASVGGGNSTNKGLWENSNTITANYTIATSYNAMSAGPITVNSGVTVTVPSGSRWVVL